MRPAFIPLAVRTLRLPSWHQVRLSPRRPQYCLPRTLATAAGSNEENDSVMKQVETKIRTAMSPTRLEVRPTYGDPKGSHVSITVVSPAFEGLSLLKRHRQVYQTIWEELSGPIHAVDELVTKTPSEDSS